jgi:hypothetical protein
MLDKLNKLLEKVNELNDAWETAIAQDDRWMANMIGEELFYVNALISKLENEVDSEGTLVQ